MMTDVTLKIEDYLSDEEKRNICFDAFYSEAKKRAGEDIERILSNSAFSVVWEAVDKSLDGDAFEIVKENALRQIRKLSSYEVFRKKNAWDREESVAYTVMQKTIRDNMQIVEDNVKIKMADVSEQYIQENLSEMICETITKLVRGEDNE